MATDEELQSAIRRTLETAREAARQGGARVEQQPTNALRDLSERRRKLLDLHYAEQISAALFAEEERRLSQQVEAISCESDREEREAETASEVSERFEAVLAILQELDLDRVWDAATEQERRVLVDELLAGVTIFPDHLEVTVHGVPRLNVLLSEVGLAQSQNAGVGGGT